MADPSSVLITGASKGIGRATALRLDASGYRVFAGVRREEDGRALRSDASDRLTPVLLDVTDAKAITRAYATVASMTDRLAGLVNNAGMVVAGPIEALPLEEIRYQFEVNVIGVLAVTQAFLPLIRRGHGHIVNVSSVNGRVVTPFVAPYSASKFALEAFSDGMRLELRRWGIPVSVIQPGATATPIWSTSTERVVANAERFDADMVEKYQNVVAAIARQGGHPPKRAVPADRVAAVIERALSARRPRARYIVGADARLGAIFALLPDRFKDYLLTRRQQRRRQSRP